MTSKKVVFMGTPEFASTVLQHLVENSINVVGVVTTPDKPAGRGQKIHTSAVKEYALSQHIPLLQPEKLKNEDFLKELKDLQADVFVVVAFRMLPEEVWSMPSLGTINLHASLLPQYRGAAPINWAIINGETQTGVTTFFIEKEIDTGKIIAARSTAIEPNMNVGELHDELMTIGSSLVVETVNAIFNGQTFAEEQNTSTITELKSAPKIFKLDCQIDWKMDAQQIHNKIRGLSPFPTAWTQLQYEQGEKSVKLFKSSLTDEPCRQKPGTIKVENFEMFVATKNTWLKIEELQLEGKKRMDTRSFCLGVKLENAFFL
jgi:methionyl-tRNA formyltransferase